VPVPPKNSRQLADFAWSATKFMFTRVGWKIRRVSMWMPVSP
jgi:hypothetical protein